MKKRNLYLISTLLLTLATISGCKKNKADSKSDKESIIVGKWNYLKADFHSVVSGTHQYDTEPGVPGDYLMFNKDGTLVGLLDGGNGSGSWELIGNNKLKISIYGNPDWEDTLWEIKKLTASELQLNVKVEESGGYSETTIYLTR